MDKKIDSQSSNEENYSTEPSFLDDEKSFSSPQ